MARAVAPDSTSLRRLESMVCTKSDAGKGGFPWDVYHRKSLSMQRPGSDPGCVGDG